MRRLGIDYFKALAASRGGECLGLEYVNNSTKLTWRCDLGHTWMATPASVKRGSWCPKCAGRGIRIKDLQEIAARRGGCCLSPDYLGSHSRHLWRCDKGHEWQATAASVISGTWCRTCGSRDAGLKRRSRLAEYQELARERGGECLSTDYVNSHTKLKWRCSCGHVWEAKPNNIKNGQWCRKCSIEQGLSKRRIAGLEACRELARERGGECVSTCYRNSGTPLEWRCADGHEWFASLSTVKHQGSWCPTCSAGLGERITRTYFEQLLGVPFPKRRPRWLTNSRGNQMELDGYSRSLAIAFEHQGEQHYSTRLPFARSGEQLAQRRLDDARKEELCAQRKILLVVIPEVPRLTPPDALPALIRTALLSSDIPLNPAVRERLQAFETIEVLHQEAYRVEWLTVFRDIAKSRNGTLVSTSYLGMYEKLSFRCHENHLFEAAALNIIHNDTWCPKCGNKRAATKLLKPLIALQRLAHNKRGRLLSQESMGAHKKHVWVCADGHVFQATPANVSQGKWCATCARTKRRDERTRQKPKYFSQLLRRIQSRGGQLLSSEYRSAKATIEIQCSEGHVWYATADRIGSGAWCPECRGGIRYSLERAKMLALTRGGECLSDSYVNSSSPLQWKCSEGHVFRKSYSHVKAGRWCNVCNQKAVTR